MKVNFITTSIPAFKGIREDRNTVSQLKENNNYSLTEPNQRRINQAIENLAKQRGEENIKFLLDVGENLKYQGHIPNKTLKSKNEWSDKLKGAAQESLVHSNPILQNKYQPEIERVFAQKPLTKEEKEIDVYKNRILKRLKDKEELDDVSKNLDYFITSSETPIEQKKYVMKRLDYFMSPKYKINEQLKDKKPKVLSELVNDISNNPESNIPNIKAINQKTHGMCAAISIARKAVAYEDKPNYVDAVLSELDNTDSVKVYDRQNLGSGKRIPVKKAYVDFDYAQERGYRIVDASTLQWMNIAGMFGSQNENLYDFNAFDKNNFDAFHDSFFSKSLPDGPLMQKQAHFQALTKAKQEIGNVKSAKIKSDIEKSKNIRERKLNIEDLANYNKELKGIVNDIAKGAKKESKQEMFSDLMKLSQPISSDIKNLPEKLQKYAFIPNEEASQKQKKVEAYFNDNYENTLINGEILSKKSETIVNNLEDIKKIDKKINMEIGLPKQIANARKLYEAEAAYRASIAVGLMETDHHDDVLITMNIPDRETRISQGYDKVINKIEKHNDKKLLEHFAPYFDTTPDDKAGIVEGLKDVKNSVDFIKTQGFDDLYTMMGYGNRNLLLVNDMADCIESIKANDKKELHRAATCMNMKQDKNKVLKTLEAMKSNLEANPQDENLYTEAFNKMGYKDQVNAFVSIFNIFATKVSDKNDPERDLYIASFKETNGLTEAATTEEVIGALQNLGNQFNFYSQTLANAAEMLNVPNEDGSMYFTVDSARIVTKKLENDGKLVPAKTMKKLQERFAKIDKIRSSDEFASRQGKISDPSLYKMSHEEKQAIKQIDKKLNMMYSEVIRERNNQFLEIKEPLEELARYVGTNSGSYWVGRDGQSGLSGSDQIKIFEQITDRPHYEIENVEDSFDIIKNGVHSGVSSSNVFHNGHGWHAMYIADIVKDEKTGKDILYHDNSWGPSEHENTWVDSNGLTRTDYSDIRGGETGYITNEEWRNGNFTDELIKRGHIASDNVENKVYNRIKPNAKDEFDYSMLYGVIVEGNNPEYKNIAGTIKDEIFVPDTPHIKTLEKLAKNMTKKEIQKAIFRNESLGEQYKKNYDTIIKRITPTTFNKGITSEEEYNALPDNDIVKLAFEKAAVRNSFEDASMYKELGGLKSVKEVEKVKEKQRKRAKEDFEYAFGKNSATNNPFLYAAYDHGSEFSYAAYNALKAHDIKIPTEKVGDIIHNLALLEKNEVKQWDGSVRHSIEMFNERAAKQFDKVVPKSEQSELAKEEFLKNLNEIYEKHVYFNKEDLKVDTPKTRGIKSWIDETFKPTTDDEFVKIYRMLQDMPKSEFDKYTKNLTDKQLGMKETTGYQLLKNVQASVDPSEQLLRNTLFYDEYSSTLQSSKTRENYRYKKLERNSRGAFYVGTRAFDDLYRSMYFSLQQLEYKSMFNKYKEQSFRKHGVLPAYPKLDLGEDPVMNEKIETTKNVITQTLDTVAVQKNCIYTLKLGHELDAYRKSIPADRALTPIEHKVLKQMTGDFITANIADDTMENTLNSAYEIMDLDETATLADYNKRIDDIIDTVKIIENVNTIQDFEESNNANTKALDDYFKTILNANIPPKYQRLIREDLKNLYKLEALGRKNNNVLDRNRTIIDLQTKISDNAKINDKKGQIEGFVEIMERLNDVKIANVDKKKTQDVLTTALSDIHQVSDKYIEKFVSNNKQANIKANMDDWFRKELMGNKMNRVTVEEVENARNKLETDIKKHHVTSHPTEILNNFLLLSAKDAENTRQVNTYKKYLGVSLDMAKYIAIQDAMMEAVKLGNASQVQKYFDEYTVDPYNNDNPVSMGSDVAIDFIVRNLIADNNPEAANMFIEKLGLGERILKLERATIKEVNPKQKVDEMAKILRDGYKLSHAVKTELDTFLEKLDDSNDVDKLILQTKRKISKATKFSDDKKNIKEFMTAMDDIGDLIKDKPEISKTAIAQNRLNEAFENVNEEYNNRVQDTQSYINAVSSIYQLLRNIQLPEYSSGKKLQQQIIKEHDAFTAYNNKVLHEVQQENPNIETKQKDYS